MEQVAEVLEDEDEEREDEEKQEKVINPEDFGNIFNMRGEFYLKSIQKAIGKEVRK